MSRPYISLKWRGGRAYQVCYTYRPVRSIRYHQVIMQQDFLPRLPSLIAFPIDTIWHPPWIIRSYYRFLSQVFRHIDWPSIWDDGLEPGIQDVSIGEGDAMDYGEQTSTIMHALENMRL